MSGDLGKNIQGDTTTELYSTIYYKVQLPMNYLNLITSSQIQCNE
jgi:hypothetical protein